MAQKALDFVTELVNPSKSATTITAGLKTLMLTLCMLLLCSCSSAPLAHIEGDPARFLAALEGEWRGQATITPAGPLRYDIALARTEPARVQGSVKLRAAIHYWTFYEQDGQLRLRFLTTFRKNSTPIWLAARAWNHESVVFQAEEPELLRVQVVPSASELAIDVFHWDKLHVSIRLSRVINQVLGCFGRTNPCYANRG